MERYQRLLLVVAAARAGAPACSAELSRAALGVLATATAIVDGLAVERWAVVHTGLAAGASVAEVGAALGGLEPDEIAAGLRAWADRQFLAGALTHEEYTGVVALVGAA